MDPFTRRLFSRPAELYFFSKQKYNCLMCSSLFHDRSFIFIRNPSFFHDIIVVLFDLFIFNLFRLIYLTVRKIAITQKYVYNVINYKILVLGSTVYCFLRPLNTNHPS